MFTLFLILRDETRGAEGDEGGLFGLRNRCIVLECIEVVAEEVFQVPL